MPGGLTPPPSIIESGFFTPEPSGPGEIPVSQGTSSFDWEAAAVEASATPLADTLNGNPGTGSGTYAGGPHSHPLSTLYDRFGVDNVNVVASSGSTQTIPDPTVYQLTFVKLTANCSFTLPTPAVGKRFEIYFQQDSMGSRLVTLPPSVGWVGGAQPTFSTVAGYVDRISFKCLDGVNWFATVEAIGIQPPPIPLSVIQVASVDGFNVPSLTLPNDVTLGSSLLAVVVGQYNAGSVPPTPSGGGVAWQQLGTLSSPAAPTVTPGVAGATSYSYKITYKNALGETLASTATTIANGNASLAGGNRNRVSWPAAPADATFVSVYGRTSGSYLHMADVAVGATQFDDDGSVTPSGAVPADNSTGNIGGGISGATNIPRVFLGTNSTGGPGTASISLGQVEACWIAEIQNAVPETSAGALAKSKAGVVGNWPGAETESTPAMTAARSGAMPFHVMVAEQYALTGPGGAWVSTESYWGGAPGTFGANEIVVLYQASTTNGNSYGTSILATRVSAGAGTPYEILSFFLKPGP